MTTTATHTPGPYTVILTHRKVPTVVCAGPNGGLIARCDTRKPDEENRANATLLAAAPDLLAALQEIATHGDDDHPCEHESITWCLAHIERVARAAIAAATGEDK